MRTRRQLPLTTTVISPLPKIPTAQHGCNGCAVDNDPRALDSLSAVIAGKVPTAYVVWTATSGCEAIERCQDANGHVSLLILDMSMEGLQGPATCRRLRLMGQRMPILGATSFSINSYRDKLVEAGAQGLVGKENADQLAQIIMRMCNGEVMEGFEPYAEGMLDRDIAERLGISEATIRKHMQSILRKLNCKTSRQAVALWVRSNAL